MNLAHFRRHPALLAAVGLTLGIGLMASPWMGFVSGLLLGWDAGILLYLGIALTTGCAMSADALRARAEQIDEGANTVTTGSVLASLVALTAVVVELSGRPTAWSAPLAGATIILSWAFIHVLFAHRYAHENALRGGLDFPGEDQPDFTEALYLAFTVGMTAQVSDVTTRSAAMRRLVLLHAILAFLFNAAVVAAAVNLAAGLAA